MKKRNVTVLGANGALPVNSSWRTRNPSVGSRHSLGGDTLRPKAVRERAAVIEDHGGVPSVELAEKASVEQVAPVLSSPGRASATPAAA